MGVRTTALEIGLQTLQRRVHIAGATLLVLMLIAGVWGAVARGHLESGRSFGDRLVRTATFRSIDDTDNITSNEIAQQAAISESTLQADIPEIALQIDDQDQLWVNDQFISLASYLDNSDTLEQLNCADGETIIRSFSAWQCGDNGSTSSGQSTLAFNGTTLSIVGSNSISLANLLDNSDILAGLSCLNGQVPQRAGGSWQCANAGADTDDQTISLAGNTLSIQDGNSVNLAAYLDNTDTQSLSIVSDFLSISGAAGSINLAGYLDNTDTLAGLSCSSPQIARHNGVGWACSSDLNSTYTASNGLTLASGSDVELGGTLERDTVIDLSTFELRIESNELRVGDAGSVDLATGDGDLYVEDAAEIDGQARIGGLAELQGNVELGDAATDTISFLGRADTAIVPLSDDAHDLGTSTLRWRDLYLGPASLHIGADGDDATISYDTVTDLLNIDQNLVLDGDINVNGGDIRSATAINLQPAAGQDVTFSLSGSGDLAINVDDLYIDTSLGRVGIGTSTPGATLDIVGSFTVSGVATFNGGITADNILTIEDTHFVSDGAAPTTAASAAAGSGATSSIAGTDVAGRVTVTTGTLGIGVGDIVSVTFDNAYSVAPVVVISPNSSLGALLDYYVTTTVNGFAIGTAVSPNSLTNYTFNYFVIE